MLTEDKIRREMDVVWTSDAPKLAKTRRFLALSKETRRLAQHMMDLGFKEYRRDDRNRCKRFWSVSAKLFALADMAKINARSALKGLRPKLGFDYLPRAYATPSWEEGQKLPLPTEVVR